MPGTIRYHTDDDVNHWPAIAKALRERGIDISTTSEVGLLSASDDDQLAHAKSTGRVLITHNEDFIAMHSLNPDHSGIIFIRQGFFSIGQVVRGLVLIWEANEADEMVGHLEYLSRSHTEI
ncbi:hypothetical protein BH23PLA1_BH23PLA1_42070 [soil metagenome]